MRSGRTRHQGPQAYRTWPPAYAAQLPPETQPARSVGSWCAASLVACASNQHPQGWPGVPGAVLCGWTGCAMPCTSGAGQGARRVTRVCCVQPRRFAPLSGGVLSCHPHRDHRPTISPRASPPRCAAPAPLPHQTQGAPLPRNQASPIAPYPSAPLQVPAPAPTHAAGPLPGSLPEWRGGSQLTSSSQPGPISAP